MNDTEKFNAVVSSLICTANENGIDCLTTLAEMLPDLLRERTVALETITDAANCIVCAAIADPMEVCENTLAILMNGKRPAPTDELLFASTMEMLKPALLMGCAFDVSSANGVLTIDLNTDAKSECCLKIQHKKVYAHRRYSRIDVVHSFEHLLDLVHDCAHNRGYFHAGWLRVFEAHDMCDPRITL